MDSLDALYVAVSSAQAPAEAAEAQLVQEVTNLEAAAAVLPPASAAAGSPPPKLGEPGAQRRAEEDRVRQDMHTYKARLREARVLCSNLSDLRSMVDAYFQMVHADAQAGLVDDVALSNPATLFAHIVRKASAAGTTAELLGVLHYLLAIPSARFMARVAHRRVAAALKVAFLGDAGSAPDAELEVAEKMSSALQGGMADAEEARGRRFSYYGMARGRAAEGAVDAPLDPEVLAIKDLSALMALQHRNDQLESKLEAHGLDVPSHAAHSRKASSFTDEGSSAEQLVAARARISELERITKSHSRGGATTSSVDRERAEALSKQLAEARAAAKKGFGSDVVDRLKEELSTSAAALAQLKDGMHDLKSQLADAQAEAAAANKRAAAAVAAAPAPTAGAADESTSPPPAPAVSAPPAEQHAEVESLKQQVLELQAKLAVSGEASSPVPAGGPRPGGAGAPL